MRIKDFDYLSPKITIFYHARNRHSSTFGGALSIFLVFIVSIYVIYCIINICYHKSANYNSYKIHVKNPGYFAFSKKENSIFHFFQLLNIENDRFTKFNTKYVRIFMTHTINGYNNVIKNLKDGDHWVYDECRKGIDDKNFPEIAFDNRTNFEGGACIRYYYNHINKKYYSIDDIENFIYPTLSNGYSSNEFSYLNTIVEKCHNDSILFDILGPCETDIEIDKYFDNTNNIYMHLLELQIQADNYYNPYFHYLNSISGTFLDDSRVSVNNINLGSFEVEIKKGIIYPEIKKIKTYALDQSGKDTLQNIDNEYILSIFNFYLINTTKVFKGEYKTLYDMLSNVGGIMQCLYYIFFAINFISNKYKIIQDSKNLFFQSNKASIKAEREKSNFGSMSHLFKKVAYNKPLNTSSSTNILKPNYMIDQLKKEKNIKLSKTINDFNFKNLNKNKSNNENINYSRISTFSLSNNFYHNKTANLEKNAFKLYNKDNNISMDSATDNNINNNNDVLKHNIINYNRSMDGKKIKNDVKIDYTETIIDHPGKKNYSYFSKNLNKFIHEKRKSIKVPYSSVYYLKEYITFFRYLTSIICPKAKKGKIFYIINTFRKRLISEEHLFNNQVFLYYLGKYFDISESEKIDFMELFNYL